MTQKDQEATAEAEAIIDLIHKNKSFECPSKSGYWNDFCVSKAHLFVKRKVWENERKKLHDADRFL